MLMKEKIQRQHQQQILLQTKKIL